MQDPRYGKVAIGFHWLIALCLIGQMAFGFLLDDIAPRGTPMRGPTINLHKSFGMVLGLLILARVGWRLWHQPPGWPASMAAWQQRAALWGHRALYVCMLVLPLSGYLGSNFSRNGVVFFGLKLAPWGPNLPEVYRVFNTIHVVTAWLLALLIAGHVLAALKHALVDRDEVFSRMLP
jgi:cytochrome b561